MMGSRVTARAACALLLAELLLVPPALANPSGGVVRGGSASISGQGTANVTIRQSSKTAILSWQSFNVQQGESTSFVQPGRSSVAINRILDGSPSQILGSLSATGHVYLINPNGILFGPKAQVNVGALTAATSAKASQQVIDLGNGFDPSARSAPGAAIVNQGQLTAFDGGSVYLIAPRVENAASGVIQAPNGDVLLAAGATVYLTDGSGLAVEFQAPGEPGGAVLNVGHLVADGGLVRMRAGIVSQQGIAEANAAREQNGKIELYADESLTLGAGSVTAASGGDGAGPGGAVSVYSAGDATTAAGSVIDVSGGSTGGDGGSAEISAKGQVTLGGTVEAGAAAGSKAGQVRVDPDQLTLTNGTSFAGAGRVELDANELIQVADGTTVNLASPSAGDGTADRQSLTLRSGGDISFGSGSRIEDDGTGAGGQKIWNVQLVAGADLSSSDPLALKAGSDGGVYLSGATYDASLQRTGRLSNDGTVSLTNGDLTVRAAGDVWVGTGGGLQDVRGNVDVQAGGDVRFVAGSTTRDSVIESGSGDVSVVAQGSVILQGATNGNAAIRTRGVLGTDSTGRATVSDGGNVFVEAVTGDVITGMADRWVRPGSNVAHSSLDPLPVVDDGILGIGTEAGGDVTVIAGGNVVTRPQDRPRTGGSAFTLDGSFDYSGGHIGVFGSPHYADAVVDDNGNSSFESIPGAASGNLLVIAGGDISGDYMERGGRAVFRAGYQAKEGVEATTLSAVDPAALDAQLELSATALGDPSRGWFGPLSAPVTVDLVEGQPVLDPSTGRILIDSIDGKGANGVALRAIENPSLVYLPNNPNAGSFRVPTYSPGDSARIEAERGDVVWVGNDIALPQFLAGGGVTAPAPEPLVRLLPPSLTVVTHQFSFGAGWETRGGDLVLLNDGLLFPSARGGLTLDVAGQVRTAGYDASQPSIVTLNLASQGAAADQAITLPAGTLLTDPTTGVEFRLPAAVGTARRLDAMPAFGEVRFIAAPSAANQAIDIPQGTLLRTADGRLYETSGGATILSPSQRLSTGQVAFFAAGIPKQNITIQAGTVLSGPDGTQFVTTSTVTLLPGMTSATAPVQAIPSEPGRDAPADGLRLVRAIAGIASATNLQPTTRPAQVDVPVQSVGNGTSFNLPLAGTITGLVNPVPGIGSVANLGPISGGLDTAKQGFPANSGLVALTVQNGPIDVSAAGHALQLVDPSVLPPGISPSDLLISVGSVSTQNTLIPVVFRSLQITTENGVETTHVDPAPGSFVNVPINTVWARDGQGATATLQQSDASPTYDARGFDPFAYGDYYSRCRSGGACPVPGFDPAQDPQGTGKPTHEADRVPSLLSADGGFARVAFDLAKAFTLLTSQGDVVDVRLSGEHTDASQVSQVLVPNGDLLLGDAPRTLTDASSGSTLSIDPDVRSGIELLGPGTLQVLVGAVPFAQADTNHDGVITPDEFLGSKDQFDAFDRENGVADGKLTPQELPFLPTGKGGEIRLADVVNSVAAGGILTTGDIRNSALPTGGASLDVAAGKDVELGSRGAIGSLQGGDVSVTAIGGEIAAGTPPAGYNLQRGIFTLVSDGGGTTSDSGGGGIQLLAFQDISAGGSGFATLSGGDISLESVSGSIKLGSGEGFSNPLVQFLPGQGGLSIKYDGSGVDASGKVTILAKKDIDLGAGITGAGVTLKAGGNIGGSGAVTSSLGIDVSAGGNVSGLFAAGSGSLSVNAGSTSGLQGSSSGGLVTGAGANASNTGGSRTNAASSLASSEGTQLASAGGSGLGGDGNALGPRQVAIDVSSRPCDSDQRCQ